MPALMKFTTSIAQNWLVSRAISTVCASGALDTSHIISDEQLLIRVMGGDNEALELFINRHANAIFSCIRNRVRSRETADDLFQETWIRVIERCDTYRSGSAVLPWLYRIAINVINDHARRAQAMRRGGDARHVPLSEAEAVTVSTTTRADQVLIIDQQKAMLHQKVMELPEPYGEVVRLRFFEELSVADVAAVLNCAEGTVKSRLSRGLALLQSSMEDGR